MSSRYFFGENADRPIRVGKINYPFEIIGRSAMTAQGVVAVPEAQASAFAAVATKLGVYEITQEEYDAALLKKKATRYLPGYVQRGTPPRAAALTGKGAVVVPGGSVKPAAVELPAAVEDVVVIASATTAPTENAASVAPAARAPRKPKAPAPVAAPVVTDAADADSPL